MHMQLIYNHKNVIIKFYYFLKFNDLLNFNKNIRHKPKQNKCLEPERITISLTLELYPHNFFFNTRIYSCVIYDK